MSLRAQPFQRPRTPNHAPPAQGHKFVDVPEGAVQCSFCGVAWGTNRRNPQPCEPTGDAADESTLHARDLQLKREKDRGRGRPMAQGAR